MTLTWIRRAAVAASAAALALLGWTGVAQAAPTPVPPPAVTATGGADAALAESLTSLREEEKLARGPDPRPTRSPDRFTARGTLS